MVFAGRAVDGGEGDGPAAAHAYRVVLAYDGRGYYGWQRLSGRPTIQGRVEEAVTEAFGESSKVRGASRTDRGAHAEGQVAGFLLDQVCPGAEVQSQLNAALPAEIRVLEACEVDREFHPRESAVAKEYRYLIWNREGRLPEEREGRVWHVPGASLNVDAMKSALPAIVGRHDFASFGTKSPHSRRDTEREIFRADLEVEEDGALIGMRFLGDSFLNHMVRNIVRAVVKIGEGRHGPRRLAKILKERDRAAAIGSAPASGLYLMRVLYAGDEVV